MTRSFVALFIVSLFLSPGKSFGQWVQTNLGQEAQYGYSLHSSGTTVYAGTLNGVYATSSDGNPWFSLGPAGRLTFDVITIGSSIIAACESAEAGIYVSSDNGSSWVRRIDGLSNPNVRCLAKNSVYLFAGTWGGGVFRSADSGKTWQSAGLDGEAVTSLLTVGSTLFAGSTSMVHFSTDNGTTWSQRSLPYPASELKNLYYDGSRLYACDLGLYTSSDLGNSWNLEYGVLFDQGGTATSVKQFMDMAAHNSVLLASIRGEGIQRSFDGGAHWEPFNEGLENGWSFAGLAALPPFMFAVRDFFSNAYRRELSSITGIEDRPGTIPNEPGLSQNYPNPFNPTTVISYQLPAVSNVSLKIFDLLGREVELLVCGHQQAGDHAVSFDASYLPGGVYLYRLQAGNFMEWRRMVLVR